MDNIDGRKIPDSVREQIRFDAIKDWQEGLTAASLAIKYGTSKKIIYEWIGRYRQDGWDGLKTRTGKTGPKPRLSQEQEQQLKTLLRTKTPLDYGYETSLWTCQIIAELIKQTFQVNYVPSGVARLLKRMGLSSQKPCWRAWEQDKKKSMNG